MIGVFYIYSFESCTLQAAQYRDMEIRLLTSNKFCVIKQYNEPATLKQIYSVVVNHNGF